MNEKAQAPSQSAPTILVYQVDLIFFKVWNLKKSGPKYGPEKSRMQITMTLFFSSCFFQVHILDLIFFKVANRPMFSKQE